MLNVRPSTTPEGAPGTIVPGAPPTSRDGAGAVTAIGVPAEAYAGTQASVGLRRVDLSRPEAHAYVDETDIGKVSAGQPTSFTVDAYPDREFAGSITAIYPKALIQRNVVTYDVVIAVDNRDGLLRPDMTTNVTITVARREQALSVPNGAVRREGGERFVLVAEGTGFVRRPITTAALRAE